MACNPKPIRKAMKEMRKVMSKYYGPPRPFAGFNQPIKFNFSKFQPEATVLEIVDYLKAGRK